MMKPYFLLPSLAFSLLSPAFAAEFTVKNSPDKGEIDVLREGKILGRYMYQRDTSTPERTFETAKTFLHIFDAEGKDFITAGTESKWYPHHRGIFIGWNYLKVDGKTEDLWHVKNTEQIHKEFLDADKNKSGITSLVHWNGKSGKTLLEEKRSMIFTEAPAPAYAMVDFSSTLTAVAGEAKLGGDTEHAGLQFRSRDNIIENKTRYLFPKENADARKDLDYPWVVQSVIQKDTNKTYHVIYLNHPENPTNTHFSAYRGYGRFGAFFQGTIPKGESLTLKARFIFLEGDLPSAEWIQQQSNAFTGLSEPTPATTHRK